MLNETQGVADFLDLLRLSQGYYHNHMEWQTSLPIAETKKKQTKNWKKRQNVPFHDWSKFKKKARCFKKEPQKENGE